MTRALTTNSHRRKPAVHGVTLVELLVVMVVISIMAGAVMAGLQKAQNTAREARTKATIAKLNHFITFRIESYKARRIPVPINVTMQLTPLQAAAARLYAMRDLIRMEMPERPEDITSGPLDIGQQIGVGSFTIPEPALHQLYSAMYNTPGTYGRQAMGGTYAATPVGQYQAMIAKFLYLTVMTGNGEARQQFQQTEIMADTDGWPMFVDGWGRPIVWLRWAPGCSSGLGGISDIQSGNSTTDHDPFDFRNVEPSAFQLIPLILSAAGHKDSSGNDYYGVNLGGPLGSSPPTLDPFDNQHILYGTTLGPTPIHNHYIEAK